MILPRGLMIMRYDNKSGISIEAKYPNEELFKRYYRIF